MPHEEVRDYFYQRQNYLHELDTAAEDLTRMRMHRAELVPKIGFFFYNIFIDEAHKVTVQIAGLDTIYEIGVDTPCFAHIQTGESQGQPPHEDARETTASYLAGFLPLHEDFKLGLGKKDELDYDCPYFFVGFIVQHRLLKQTRVIGVSYPSSDHPLFSITNIGYAHVKSLHKENLMTMIRSIYPDAVL